MEVVKDFFCKILPFFNGSGSTPVNTKIETAETTISPNGADDGKVNKSPISLRVLNGIGNSCWWKKVALAALGVVLIAAPLMLGSSFLFLSIACIGAAIEIVLIVASCLNGKKCSVDSSPENTKTGSKSNEVIDNAHNKKIDDANENFLKQKFLAKDLDDTNDEEIDKAHEVFPNTKFSRAELLSPQGLAALQNEMDGVKDSPETEVKAFVGEEAFGLIRKNCGYNDAFTENSTFEDIKNLQRKAVVGAGSIPQIDFTTMREAIKFIVALSYIQNA